MNSPIKPTEPIDSDCMISLRRFFGNSSCSYCQVNRREVDHKLKTSVKISVSVKEPSANSCTGEV